MFNIFKKIINLKTILFIGGLLIVLRLIFPVMTLEVKPLIRDTSFTVVAHFYPLIGCKYYGERCYNTRLNETRTNMQAIAIGVATLVLMVLARKKRNNS